MRNPLLARLVAGAALSLAPAAALSLALSLAAAPPALAAAPRAADPTAEAFVNLEANRALKILGDRQLSLEAKKRAFVQFVDEAADVPEITSFVLGKYRRTLTEDQYRRFAQVFRTYADNVYETRLGQYRGETLAVEGSVVRRPGKDVVVFSKVTGGQLKEPQPVNWRLLKDEAGKWRAADVEVDGVWLAITEQADFVSILDNHHGDIDVLIKELSAHKGELPSKGR